MACTVALLSTLIGVLQAGEFHDPRDGRAYATIRVGTAEWFAENLAYESEQSWCYGDLADDCAVHGRLYRWAAAMAACPAGWRVPSDEDWIALEIALGMPIGAARAERARGTDEGAKLRAGGASGLNVLISGYRRPEGEYVRRRERAAFWASTEANADDAWHRDVRAVVGTIYRSAVTKTYALSVRCVR